MIVLVLDMEALRVESFTGSEHHWIMQSFLSGLQAQEIQLGSPDRFPRERCGLSKRLAYNYHTVSTTAIWQYDVGNLW